VEAYSQIVPSTNVERMRITGADYLPFLLFWTFSAHLKLGRWVPERDDDLPGHDARRPQGYRAFSLIDNSSRRCGCIVLQDHWAREVGEVLHFVAIAMSTYHDRSKGFRRNMFHVLLVEEVDGIHYRAGSGKVAAWAFETSFPPGTDWREFILA